ncbi:hypothetical protein TL16_g00438 [Triparma laevis f. inornata]|uniref:Uncharacterized protein n=2 Tax=Triparma laevis TaxID=1534972 RepID=A0A9W7AIK8_9STRA|nr:hypothetical protein TL16_g00438 [Triparma laevis f. inornata]GMH71486.1 hypothetical protein TrLO_g3905 [Triparma laevis f. longispina]
MDTYVASSRTNKEDDAMFATPPASPTKSAPPSSTERLRTRTHSDADRENNKPSPLMAPMSPGKESLGNIQNPKPFSL